MNCCNHDCNQGRNCPNRKVYSMEKLKGWGTAFVIGATLGMFVEQYIFIQSIKKDCEVLLSFRINDIPYTCKPYLNK